MSALTSYEALKEAFRLSLDLEPIASAPAEGTTFTAFLTNGARVTAERFDDRFVVYDRQHPHLYRRPVAASEFVGWMRPEQDAPDIGPSVPTADDEYAWGEED